MPVKSFSNFEIDKGINTRYPSNRVVWATGWNVRFSFGAVEKTSGQALIATVPSGLPIRGMFSFVGTDGALRTIVATDAAVYAYNADFSTYSTITPSPAPTGGASDVWEFDLIGGMLVVSNGKDVIWKWASYAGVLTALTGAPTWAKRLSSCMNRVIVSNLTEGGYAYTGRVRWPEMGNPENWTIDTKAMSGRHDLMNYDSGISAYENVKKQIAVGPNMYFYVDRGVWKCDFSDSIKRFVKVCPEVDLLAPRAACRFGASMYALGESDIFSISGDQATSIGDAIGNDLFDTLNESVLETAFAFPVPWKDEVWFCVATGSNTTPDTAYVYNRLTKSWSIESVDFLCFVSAYYTTLSSGVVGNAAGNILAFDFGNNAYSGGQAAAIDGRIETGDLMLGAPNHMKRIADVIPSLDYQATVSELMIQVGLKDAVQDDFKWSDPVPFTIGASDKADFNGFRREGKILRVRFYSDQLDSPWRLNGYTINYELGGTR